jgi:3-deoxy-7-phosphoheptulonate synthase
MIFMENKKRLFFDDWGVIAGPCAAESLNQIIKSAKNLKKNQIRVLRAGIWKPRTSPNSWQGAGNQAIEWMIKAKQETGVKIATEINDERSLKKAIKAEFDYLWIGSRNGQNYSLLKKIGKLTQKTKIIIILKRCMSASLEEWIGASEYITKYNKNVILCERGICGFPKDTRNVLDLQTAWLAKQKSGLPVIVDVSHAAGRRDLILPMSRAVKACGFDGLMVEVHPTPEKAKTDSNQQINFPAFKRLISSLSKIKP